MPISSVTNRRTYQGDGSSAVFAFQNQLHAQSDLGVFTFNSSVAESVMIIPMTLNGAGGTGFTISGNANPSGIYPNGVNVVMNSAPNAQTVVVLFRSSVLTNTFSVGQTGTIPATSLNNELDYLTLISQRLQDQITRGVRLKDGYAPAFDPTLPAQLVASSVLLINGDRSGFIMGPQADQIATAQSSAIAAAASAAAAAASTVLANSAAVSAGNNAFQAASAALSAGNSVALVGSTGFWALSAQSSALSASNSAALANSAAVSAGNSVALIGSSLLSAVNQAANAGSAAVSATNQAVLSASGALSASNNALIANSNAQSILNMFPQPFNQYAVLYASSTTQVAGIAPGPSVGSVLTWNGSSAPTYQNVSIAAGSGIIDVANGGTGRQGAQQFSVAVWAGSSAMSTGGPSTAGNVLLTAATGAPTMGSPSWLDNILVNSAFDHWQAFASGSSAANGQQVYFADQWYVHNYCGTSAVVTCSRISGKLGGSINACQVQITVAPTLGQTTGCELWQVLESNDVQSKLFCGSSANFSAQIKALGNVNQVGIQFFQAGTATKTSFVSSSVASEATFSVNSSGFVDCFNSVNMTYAAGSSGVIGMRIRITGVSTGSTHVLNNGFIVEQAGMWAGTNPVRPAWSRRSKTVSGELYDCQRFYSLLNFGLNGGSYSTTNAQVSAQFKNTMRIHPTITQEGVIILHEPSAATFTQSAPSVAASYPGPNGVSLLLGNFTGMTAFRPLNYNSSGTIVADARI